MVVYKKITMMRGNVLPFADSTCTVHFADSQLKILRGSKQYVYDEQGNEYLDCVSNSAHGKVRMVFDCHHYRDYYMSFGYLYSVCTVGHCHPHVVAAGHAQMSKLGTSHGFLNETSSKYVRKLLETLPESLSAVFLVNSGSEANDLALRLARQSTRRPDVAVFNHGYYGNLSSCVDISSKVFRKLPQGKKDYVHLIPLPKVSPVNDKDGNTENGDNESATKFFEQAKAVIEKAHADGRPIGCFISELVIAAAGVVVPPKNYFQHLYQFVRQQGGLCVAVENHTGLGRTGHYWAFEAFDVVPDILCVGKPLGSGYPVAAVITTSSIAECLGDYFNTMGGNPVACSIGTAVLQVIAKENLVSSARIVGRLLLDGLRQLMNKYTIVGDVRGMGLCIGVEMVCGRPNMKPATFLANRLLFRLKDERIIVSIQGSERNIIALTPPMCFNIENARRVIEAFDKALEKVNANEEEVESPVAGPSSFLGVTNISTDILAEDMSHESGESSSKRRRQYEEMD